MTQNHSLLKHRHNNNSHKDVHPLKNNLPSQKDDVDLPLENPSAQETNLPNHETHHNSLPPPPVTPPNHNSNNNTPKRDYSLNPSSPPSPHPQHCQSPPLPPPPKKEHP